MAEDRSGGEGSTSESGGASSGAPSSRSPVVFVSDASAEAERLAMTLRAAGYLVTDVALSLLTARVTAQRPSVVLVDIDATGALAELARVRRIPGAAAIDFVYLGDGAGPVKNADDALAQDGSAFFPRPVDVGGLVRKIEALTGGPAARPEVRPSTPPPSLPLARLLGGEGARPGASRDGRPGSESPPPSLPGPGVRTPGPPLPMSTTSLADLVDMPRSLASFGSVSPELAQLLEDAELRAELLSSGEIPLPSPEEELEAVLPADVLASLDEPLEGDEEEDAIGLGVEGPRPNTSAPHEGTGAHTKGTTSGGTRQSTTGGGVRTGAHTHERRGATDTPMRTGAGSMAPTPTPALPAVRARSEARHEERAGAADVGPGAAGTGGGDAEPRRPSSWAPPPMGGSSIPPAELRGPSVQPGPPSAAATALGDGDARRYFAEAVARRATGALCFETDGVVRRIVMRDGDLVAAASAAEDESLVRFLASRGELPRDEAPRLAAKIPPYGRHAGAAMVAHGWLRQDQLWGVLRAHAEWIATAILRLPRGVGQLEPEPPGRLRAEPSVFGASTGASIFVELVRRAVPPDEAVGRLGGEASRIADGPNLGLLSECHLSASDLEVVARARGGSLGDLLVRSPDPEIAAVIHALALLGVVEIVLAPAFGAREAREAREGRGGHDRDPRGEGRSRPEMDVAALDEEAIRARVRARMELVEEGDYFALLGVARDATSYEVRRAFLELRRAFEPSRVLVPGTLDLTDDVQKIVVVIEEAYEILRDAARRERYRRAIDARPD